MMSRKALYPSLVLGALMWFALYLWAGPYLTICFFWITVAGTLGVLAYHRAKKVDDGYKDIDWDRVFDDVCSEVAQQTPKHVTPISRPPANENAFMLDDESQPKRAS